MERCLDCNSLLTREEKVCIECGTKVGGADPNPVAYVASLVSLLFYLSVLALVIVHLLHDDAPGDRFPRGQRPA